MVVTVFWLVQSTSSRPS